jgi:hypothetical protein
MEAVRVVQGSSSAQMAICRKDANVTVPIGEDPQLIATMVGSVSPYLVQAGVCALCARERLQNRHRCGCSLPRRKANLRARRAPSPGALPLMRSGCPRPAEPSA